MYSDAAHGSVLHDGLHFNGGEICPRMTKERPYYAGFGLYKCADGYIVMELDRHHAINEVF